MRTKHLLPSFFILVISFKSHAQLNECIYSVNNEISCTTVEHKPFGKTVKTQIFNNNGELISAEFEGADSSVYLFPDLSVYYSEEYGWWLGNLNIILLKNLSSNNIYTFLHHGELWQLNINEVTFPNKLRGIATESVNQISFSINKIIK